MTPPLPVSVSPARISVCICTHNGAAHLLEVLAALNGQQEVASAWELIIVDNASTDGCAAKAEGYLQGGFSAPWRICVETVLGISHARRRAAVEARYEVVVFLDDDTIPANDFLANAARVFHRFPQAGAVGGRILPEWEVPPTALAEAVAEFALAICDRGGTPFQYAGVVAGPVTAGMCARTEALKAVYADATFINRVTGARGPVLLRGEDTAIVVRLLQLGYKCVYDPSLLLRHIIPQGRMSRNYLARLFAGIGRGQASVRRLYDWKARSPLGLLIAAKDFGRYFRGGFRGPSPELRSQHPEVARELHELQQLLVRARALEGLAWRK